MDMDYKEYRCECGKLLFKGLLIESEVQIKCRGCGKIISITGEKADKYLCMTYPCPRRIPAPAQK